jgi:hypothetical protein
LARREGPANSQRVPTNPRTDFFDVFRTKQFSPLKKPFSAAGEAVLKQLPIKLSGPIKQRSSVMSALLTLIYHEFCKARLAEMRKHILVDY